MRYYKCSDIETVDGNRYNSCVVGIPEIQPTGNLALDRQTILDNVMVALEDTIDSEVECFSNMEEMEWE